MRRTRTPFVLVPLLLILIGCPSGSGGGISGIIRTGDTTISELRFESTAAAWPALVLHWRAELRAKPPSSFRIFLGPKPLTDANRSDYLITEVDGEQRSATVDMPRSAGLRYLAVQAMESNRSPGHVSKTLPVDTTDRLAFQVLDGSRKQVWMTDTGGKARLVAPRGENLGWTPGSRGLGIVSPDDNKASVITPDIWKGKLGANSVSAPSVPDRPIPADWFSMRFSSTGLVAYRVGPKDSVALFVRAPTGKVTRVSARGGDVGQFAWSPSGSHLLFLQQHGSSLNRHAYVVAADGSDLRAVNGPLGVDEYVYFAHWSHSGDAVAFHVVDAKTSNVGMLSIHNLSDRSTPLDAPSTHQSVWRGAELLFATQQALPSAGMGISIYRPVGPGMPRGTVTPLVQFLGSIFALRLSPDHRWLAFVLRDAGQQQTAILLELSNNTLTELTIPAGTSPSRLEWSASGRYLAVSLAGGTRGEIRVFDGGTSFQTSAVWVTGSSFRHFEWSPFQEELAVLRAEPALRLVRADGTRVVEISIDVPPRLSVVDFVWSNWAMSRTRGVFSTLVGK